MSNTHKRVVSKLLLLLSGLLLSATARSPEVARANEAGKDKPDLLLDFERPFEHAIRGLTVGPIENARHASRGYGSAASSHTFRVADRLGANWVSLTPFGRVWDLAPRLTTQA
jgi:hypothetical protein